MTLNNIPLDAQTAAEVQRAIRAMLAEHCGKCTGWHSESGLTGYCPFGGKTDRFHPCDVPTIPVLELRKGA